MPKRVVSFTVDHVFINLLEKIEEQRRSHSRMINELVDSCSEAIRDVEYLTKGTLTIFSVKLEPEIIARLARAKGLC